MSNELHVTSLIVQVQPDKMADVRQQIMAIENAVYGTMMPGPKGWLIILYIALIPSFVSQIFFMRGVDLIGSGSAGLYANLVPVFSAIIAVILLGEIFSLYHLSAMIFVFGGIALFEHQKRMKI